MLSPHADLQCRAHQLCATLMLLAGLRHVETRTYCGNHGRRPAFVWAAASICWTVQIRNVI